MARPRIPRMFVPCACGCGSPVITPNIHSKHVTCLQGHYPGPRVGRGGKVPRKPTVSSDWRDRRAEHVARKLG